MNGSNQAMAVVVVLYNHPTDASAFERYYTGTHLPLLEKHAREIGHARAQFMKFTTTLDGQKPPFYRKAELWFDSMDALKKGTATPGFQAVAGDLANFATGGVTALVSEQTNAG
jgi:uncharacterized protein (TIGR02118 family)